MQSKKALDRVWKPTPLHQILPQLVFGVRVWLSKSAGLSIRKRT